MKKVLTVIFVVAALQLALVSIASADGYGSNNNNSYYRVRYGDTLYSIGRQYGVSANRIAQANGLSNPNHIYAGQVLYIPSGGYDGCGWCDGGNGNNGTFYRVRYGDTLYSIGRQYNVHPNHIAQVNNLYNPNYIYVGQRLRIPSGSTYPWNGGCGGYGSGSGCNDYNSGCGGYGSGCNWNNSGCGGSGSGCNWNDSGCNSGCDWNNSGCDNFGNGCSNSGYDYTGYYYNRGNQRYSFTCGQNFNCW